MNGYMSNKKNIKGTFSNLTVSDECMERIFDMTNSKSNSHSAWLTFMYPRLYLAKQLLKN